MALPKGITGTSGNLKTGFRVIEANLNKELEKIKERSNKGLLLAGIEIRRDMEGKPPLIPLQYGNLRASWFLTTKKNARTGVKHLEIKKAKFATNTPPKVLARLQSEHPLVITHMQEQLTETDIGVAMGFSAYYSAAVHEMGASGPTAGTIIGWSRPGSGAKFFQAALYRNMGKIIQIVKANATIRP